MLSELPVDTMRTIVNADLEILTLKRHPVKKSRITPDRRILWQDPRRLRVLRGLGMDGLRARVRRDRADRQSHAAQCQRKRRAPDFRRARAVALYPQRVDSSRVGTQAGPAELRALTLRV